MFDEAPGVSFNDIVETVGKTIDGAGVVVTVAGILTATALLISAVGSAHRRADFYKSYRQRIGMAILLGLEFLVAADIIRTVAVTPTFRSAGVLALIVLIRTFLSMALELELTGRWPWQGRPGARGASHSNPS